MCLHIHTYIYGTTGALPRRAGLRLSAPCRTPPPPSEEGTLYMYYYTTYTYRCTCISLYVGNIYITAGYIYICICIYVCMYPWDYRRVTPQGWSQVISRAPLPL